jgi:hypothetical protein
VIPDELKADFEKLSGEEREEVMRILAGNQKLLKENQRRLYKQGIPPPSPEQFLDYRNGWLPKGLTDKLFDHVKEDFCNILSGKKYSQVCLYGSVRSGKSVCSILLMIHAMVFAHHLASLQGYYNLISTASLSMYLMSFKYEKVYELYIQPLFQILEDSERFQRTHFQQAVKKEQEEAGNDIIIYSEATRGGVGEITLASGLQLVTGNDDALSIIGANILCAFISEIGFFIEHAGASEDQIFRIYTDTVSRIRGTVGNAYHAFTLLDSSANLAESKIEQHILSKLQYRDDVYFRWRKQWEIPELCRKFFPNYHLDKTQVFPLLIGDGEIPARILNPGEDPNNFPANLIVYPPLDVKQEFEDNLLKSIKDIAGQPTTSESKFIQQRSLIQSIFDDSLPNIEGSVIADSKEAPEHLIWNKVKDLFFTQYNGKDYTLKRAPSAERYIGIDPATSLRGDVAGIAMAHKEITLSGEVIDVFDFGFAIAPGANGINLEAIQLFIKDLRDLGHVTIHQVNVDQYQSTNMIQYLNRNEIKAIKSSVDEDIQPYLQLYSRMLAGHVKVGPNVFIRNNLDSLYRVRKKKGAGPEKIDHSKGTRINDYRGDFENSKCGIHAKDVSDAMAHCTFNMHKIGFMPSASYEKQQERIAFKKSGVTPSFANEEFSKRMAKAMASFKPMAVIGHEIPDTNTESQVAGGNSSKTF